MPKEDARALPLRYLVALFLLSFGTASALGTHGIAYWDAGDYVRLAVRGGASGLLLGRPLFLAASRAVVVAALRLGAPADAIEPTLRWTWTAVSATAPPLLTTLVARLGYERRAAWMAGVALAVSPPFAHASHQVLTDGGALALSIGSLAIAARAHCSPARAIGAGLMMACAISMRETAVVAAIGLAGILAAALPGMLAAREGPSALPTPARLATIATIAVLAGTATIVIATHEFSPASLAGWLTSMRRSSSAHPLRARDLAMSLGWLLSVGPLQVILGAHAFSGLRGFDLRTRAIVIPAAIATVLLFAYPDGAFSPRYFLATAPLAFFVPAAPRLARAAGRPAMRAAIYAGLLTPCAFARYAIRPADALADAGHAMAGRLVAAEDGALVVPGHLCPAVGAHLAVEDAVLARDTHAPMRAQRVSLLCPGWAWPATSDALDRILDDAQCDGRRVFLDLADDAWVGSREAEARDAVRRFAARQATSVRAGWTVVAAFAPDEPRCRSPENP